MERVFWETLPKSFTVLAPMEEVTDTVFRQIIIKCGRPNVFFTEFTNVDGLCSVGVERVGMRLKHTEEEKPLVVQLWGNNPEKFAEAAKMVAKLGFDGIDINMGCPQKEVLKIGGGAALIGQNELAKEIIAATKEAGLPVSVKTRIGIKKIITEEWIGFLLEQNLSAITVHGRIAAEMSTGLARWEEIGRAAKMAQGKTLIIGNGDVGSLPEVKEKCATWGTDGVMIGRGIFHNPWLFTGREGSREEKIKLLITHAKLFEEIWAGKKDFHIMRKFIKMYVNGFTGAAELRAGLMTAESAAEITSMLDNEAAVIET